MLIKISNTTKNADYVAFNFMLHSLSLNLGKINIYYLDFAPGIGAALFSQLYLFVCLFMLFVCLFVYVVCLFVCHISVIKMSHLDFTPGIGAALFSKLKLPTRIDIQGNHTCPLYYSLKLISYKNTTFVRVLKMMTKTMTKAGILFFRTDM